MPRNLFNGAPRWRLAFPALITVVSVVVLWGASAFVINQYFAHWKGDVAGQIGDTYGAVNALFSGLAFAGIIVVFFSEQHERAEGQQRDLTLKQTTGKKVRVSLDLTPKQFVRLQALENEYGTSKAELVRNAIRLFDIVVELKKKGESFRSVDKNGRETELLIVELS